MPSSERTASHSRASPSCWINRQQSGRITNSRFLKVTGLRVRYVGPGTQDKDAASVRADNCVPFGCGIYYYEVEVVNKGRNGFVGIGFSTADVGLDRLPGWEPHSFGYHGDDGHAFHQSGKGKPYGPTFGTGDVIGVIFNMTEKTIAYTKNGMHLGVAFHDVCEERLYPTVGMRTPDEEVIANFGATHFKGDLEGIMADASHRVQQQIAQCELPATPQGPRVLEQLVFDFLRHQGYSSSAAKAGEELLNKPESVTAKEVEGIQLRQRVTQAIVAGQIDEALELVKEVAPSLLQPPRALNFRLQCCKFMHMGRLSKMAQRLLPQQSSILEAVECSHRAAQNMSQFMIEQRHITEALEFGQKLLGPLIRRTEDRLLLQDALTLLAHDNPKDCPSYHELLGKEAHTQLAASVNAALLRQQGHSERSCLELVLRQLEVVKNELVDRGNPAAALIDFDKELTGKGKTA